MASSTAPCQLLRLNADCLGTVLTYCDLQTILSLRATTRESFRLRISECNLDLFLEDGAQGKNADIGLLSQLSELLIEKGSAPSRGRIHALVVNCSDRNWELHSKESSIAFTFLNDVKSFFGYTLCNMRVLYLDTGYSHLSPCGMYTAMRDAAVAGGLAVLQHCAVRINETAPPDLRSSLCAGCPLLRTLDIREYFESNLTRDDPRLHELLLQQFIAETGVWPSLQEIELGWIFERIFDEIDADSVPGMAIRIAARISSGRYPQVATLKLTVADESVLLHIVRSFFAKLDSFLGHQILALDIDQSSQESFEIQQQWNEFVSEISPAGGGLGTRRLPVLFPQLQRMRIANILPSAYLFELISPAAVLSLQAEPFIFDPALSTFLSDRYRPGVLSPIIRQLRFQKELILLPYENSRVRRIENSYFTWGSCFGSFDPASRNTGLETALMHGKLKDLSVLRVGYKIAFALNPGDFNGRYLVENTDLELLIAEIGSPGDPASEGRWSHCANAAAAFLVRLMKPMAEVAVLPQLHTLKIVVHSMDAWSYVSRHIIAAVQEEGIASSWLSDQGSVRDRKVATSANDCTASSRKNEPLSPNDMTSLSFVKYADQICATRRNLKVRFQGPKSDTVLLSSC